MWGFLWVTFFPWVKYHHFQQKYENYSDRGSVLDPSSWTELTSELNWPWAQLDWAVLIELSNWFFWQKNKFNSFVLGLVYFSFDFIDMDMEITKKSMFVLITEDLFSFWSETNCKVYLENQCCLYTCTLSDSFNYYGQNQIVWEKMRNFVCAQKLGISEIRVKYFDHSLSYSYLIIPLKLGYD